MATDISALLKDLRKTTESTTFEDCTLGDNVEFINTGNYALNRIISGSFFKGLPSDRLILISGVSQGGKTLIASLAVANAFNENKYDMVFVFDSERGVSKELFKKINIPLNKVEYVIVRTVEDFATKVMKMYDFVREVKKVNPNFKCISMLDSLGALCTRKAIKDMNDDDLKLDRGLRARMLNDISKLVTMPAFETNCSLIVLNHIYMDPNANPKYPSKIKPQSGGLGVQYMSRIQIQLERKLDRNEDRRDPKANPTEDTYYSGNTLKAMTLKNYLVVPFIEADLELDFTTGWRSKYAGLLNLAIKYKFLDDEKIQGKYVDRKGNKWKEKDLFGPKADEIWGPWIKELDEAQSKDIQYSSFCENNTVNEEASAAEVEEL